MAIDMKQLTALLLILLPVSVFSQVGEVVESIGFGDHLSPLVKVKKEGKEFLYDLKGKHWIDDVEDHAADLFVVAKDGYYGVLRENGDLIVPIAYDEIDLVAEYEGQWRIGIAYDYKFIILKKDGKAGVADENGRIIVPIRFQNAEVINKNVIGVAEGKRWGWASAKDGQILQQPQYDYITKFLSDEFVEVRSPDKSGLAKRDGQLIIPVEYDGHLQYLLGGLQTYIKGFKGGQCSLMDTSGRVLLTGYTDLKAIAGSKRLIFKQGDRYGIVDPLTRQVIADPQFETLGDFVNDRAVVRKSGLYGVIDTNGQQVLEAAYDEIRLTTANGTTRYGSIPSVSLGSSNPDIAVTDAVRKKMEYETEMAKAPNLIEVTKNGQKGIYNSAGKEIIPVGKYSNIQPHYYNGKTWYLVESNQKIGLADDRGHEVLTPQYGFDDTYQYARSKVENEYSVYDRFVAFTAGQEKDSYTKKIGLFDLKTNAILLEPQDQYIEMLNKRFMMIKRLVADYSYAYLLYDLEQSKMMTFADSVTNISLMGDHGLLLEYTSGALRLTDHTGKLIYSHPSWTSQGHYNPVRFPEYVKYPKGAYYHGLKKIFGEEGNLFIDASGTEKRFDGLAEVDDFYEGYAVAAKKVMDQERPSGFTYVRGMVDLNGKTIVPFVYDHILAVGKEGEILIFENKDGQMMVRRDGTVILGAGYQDIEASGSYPNFTFAKNGKYGLADWSGKILVPPLYERIRRNYDDSEKTWPLLVEEGGWYYFVGENGEQYRLKAKVRE